MLWPTFHGGENRRNCFSGGSFFLDHEVGIEVDCLVVDYIIIIHHYRSHKNENEPSTCWWSKKKPTRRRKEGHQRPPPHHTHTNTHTERQNNKTQNKQHLIGFCGAGSRPTLSHFSFDIQASCPLHATGGLKLV